MGLHGWTRIDCMVGQYDTTETNACPRHASFDWKMLMLMMLTHLNPASNIPTSTAHTDQWQVLFQPFVDCFIFPGRWPDWGIGVAVTVHLAARCIGPANGMDGWREEP